jgi:hypothetical protein
MADRSKDSLTLVAAEAYFHELVTDALARNKIKPQPETEFYLVHLLNRFVSTNSKLKEPLALMVKGAIEEPLPQAKQQMFKHIGDISLYTAGYFQDSLSGKSVDVDYYISMGGIAYRHVCARTTDEAHRELYRELAERFAKFVDVLADISSKTAGPKTQTDLLRMYDLWLQTKSERAARALQEAGIIPNETLKKDKQ